MQYVGVNLSNWNRNIKAKVCTFCNCLNNASTQQDVRARPLTPQHYVQQQKITRRPLILAIYAIIPLYYIVHKTYRQYKNKERKKVAVVNMKCVSSTVSPIRQNFYFSVRSINWKFSLWSCTVDEMFFFLYKVTHFQMDVVLMTYFWLLFMVSCSFNSGKVQPKFCISI